MSHTFIDASDSYKRPHDEKTAFTLKGKLGFLNNTLTSTAKVNFDLKKAETVNAQSAPVTFEYLAPSASASLNYKKGLNELSISNSDAGKFEFSLNQELFRNSNLISSLSLKSNISEKGNEVTSRLKLHHNSDKLFVLGVNKATNLASLDLKNYFQTFHLASFYGYQVSKGVSVAGGLVGNFELNTRSFSLAELHVQGKYNDLKNYLVLNRSQSEKETNYGLNYCFDTKFENVKVGGDFDLQRTAEKTTQVVRLGAEFSHTDGVFSKVMVNNKKEFNVAVGKTFNNFAMFTFGGKVI